MTRNSIYNLSKLVKRIQGLFNVQVTIPETGNNEGEWISLSGVYEDIHRAKVRPLESLNICIAWFQSVCVSSWCVIVIYLSHAVYLFAEVLAYRGTARTCVYVCVPVERNSNREREICEC